MMREQFFVAKKQSGLSFLNRKFVCSSSLLRTVFSEAARAGKRFRVIVADGRPRFEGRAMARHMVSAGIECSYIQVRNINLLNVDTRNFKFVSELGLKSVRKHYIEIRNV